MASATSALPLRHATPADLPALEQLITRSVEQLSAGFYSPVEIGSGLRYVFGADTQLIEDQSYFVVTDGDRIVGAGGWSRRATLYGGNQMKSGADSLLDPAAIAETYLAVLKQPRTAWSREAPTGATASTWPSWPACPGKW